MKLTVTGYKGHMASDGEAFVCDLKVDGPTLEQVLVAA
jgi:hypothetical protein